MHRKLSQDSFHPSQEIFRGKISAANLCNMWRRKHGMETRRYFPSADLTMEEVAPSGYFRFKPALSGDAEFYSQLMRRIGYAPCGKVEYKEAAKQIGQGQKVLDVGCGDGNFSNVCPGIYSGIDTNHTAVQDAVRMGRNVRFGVIQDEDSDAYEVITLFQVLEHIEEPGEFLKECVRCLKPGGRLVVSTPNMNGFMGYMANEVMNYPPHHMTWWSESSLKSLVEECGCRPYRVWLEPLQKNHFLSFLETFFWPRTREHITSKPISWMTRKFLVCLARLAARNWDEIPFIAGHTISVYAAKE